MIICWANDRKEFKTSPHHWLLTWFINSDKISKGQFNYSRRNNSTTLASLRHHNAIQAVRMRGITLDCPQPLIWRTHAPSMLTGSQAPSTNREPASLQEELGGSTCSTCITRYTGHDDTLRLTWPKFLKRISTRIIMMTSIKVPFLSSFLVSPECLFFLDLHQLNQAQPTSRDGASHLWVHVGKHPHMLPDTYVTWNMQTGNNITISTGGHTEKHGCL